MGPFVSVPLSLFERQGAFYIYTTQLQLLPRDVIKFQWQSNCALTVLSPGAFLFNTLGIPRSRAPLATAVSAVLSITS